MIEIRKFHTAIEELHFEAGRAVDPPLTTIIVAAVMRNPWANLSYADDLRTEIRRFAAPLGAILGERLIEAAGSPDAIQAYGKSSIVGLDGELEHAAAMVHTLLFGEEVRNRANGAGALVFTNTRAPAGAQITVPMVHKLELLTRTHYHTAQTSIVDAPRPDEVVVAVAAATGPRPFARIGDRDTDRADIQAAAVGSP
jgi:hypothetical protein